MDETSTYKKMCMKANEINQLKPSDYPESMKPITTYFYDDVWYHPKGNHPAIKLFRQDQLQEMVWLNTAGTYNLLPTKLFAFSDYWEENGIPNRFTSMEQLWLAFIMAEKYNKVWDNVKEDWIEVG